MNQIEHALKENLKQAVLKAFEIETALEDIVIEVPKFKEQGDYSSNLAMRLTKVLKSNPRLIAQGIIDQLDHHLLNEIPGLENPTSENLSIWLWNKIKPLVLGLKKIELKETPSSGVIYEGF
jgi:arginyl-tRNA synthetase